MPAMVNTFVAQCYAYYGQFTLTGDMLDSKDKDS
jgi:hypothetical protein